MSIIDIELEWFDKLITSICILLQYNIPRPMHGFPLASSACLPFSINTYYLATLHVYQLSFMYNYSRGVYNNVKIDNVADIIAIKDLVDIILIYWLWLVIVIEATYFT